MNTSLIKEVRRFVDSNPGFSGVVCVTYYVKTRRGLSKRHKDFSIIDGVVYRRKNLSFVERCEVGLDNFPYRYGTLANVFIDICNAQLRMGDVSIVFAPQKPTLKKESTYEKRSYFFQG